MTREIVIVAALALAGLTTVAPLQARTAVQSDPILTLADAIALARERHPGFDAATGYLQAIRGEARQWGAFSNPEVEWRVENLRSTSEVDRFLTATLPLGLSGQRRALRSSGRATIRAAEAEQAARLRALEFDAATAYWRAALAQSLLEAATTQRESLQALADYDATRLREGAAAEVTALRTRLEADRIRIAEASAHAEYLHARADLARALGISADSIPRLEPLIAEPAKAAWRPPALADALARARAERPELRAAAAQVEAARLRRSAERRALLPEFGLTGGVKRTNGVNGAIIGVTLPVPLLDLRGGAREAAAGELRIAEAQLREAELAVAAEVSAAVEAVEVLLAALPPDGRDLGRRGQEVAEIMEAAYREGGATLVELLEARRAAADALVAALQWHADLRIALLELNRAIGAPTLENIP